MFVENIKVTSVDKNSENICLEGKNETWKCQMEYQG
jgi:hypothetical protein